MSIVIGKPIPRKEDDRLVRGAGRYSDDVNLPGQAYAVIVRSPHAHAWLRGIDVAAAREAPGVLAVLTAEDYQADGGRGIRHLPNPTDAIDVKLKAFQRNGNDGVFEELHFPLVRDKVRHLGEAIALVVADRLDQAKNAAELVRVDYEPLPAVTQALAALEAGAPLIWEEAPGNLCIDEEFGDAKATEAAFRSSAHVIENEFTINRIVNSQMEPRASLGDYDLGTGLHTLIAGSQGVVRQKAALMEALALPANKVRVVSPDVGGAFGARTMLYPEYVLVVWAARRLGRPVKWTCERTEAFVSDYQGRDLVTRLALALDREGHFLALRAQLFGNVGAHTVSFAPLNNGCRITPTVYAFPTAHVTVKGCLTNTVPTAPYRGAGRPEAHYALERLIDIAARRLSIDRIALRRCNLVPRAEMPYRNALGLTYDSGAFEANMARALALIDWTGFPARRIEAERRGRLRGIGIANYIESPVGAPHERAEITVSPEGIVEIVLGTQSSGQGHETSFAQVVAEWLGVPVDAIRLVTGDTARVRSGGGTHSDRSLRIGGKLLVDASETIIAKGLALASRALEASVDDIEFLCGCFAVKGTDRTLGIFEVAALATKLPDLPEELRDGLRADAAFTGRLPAYPTGCAVCEVEIDPDTGATRIVRYSTVDDVGRVINPLIVDGQIHGGIVQGAGQALFESCLYEPGTGQIVTGSFVDYAMPRADCFPSFEIEIAEDPTTGNPLSVKGGGEGGTTPALAAVGNAVVDALSEWGIEHLDPPYTAERVWRAIMSGKARHHRNDP